MFVQSHIQRARHNQHHNHHQNHQQQHHHQPAHSAGSQPIGNNKPVTAATSSFGPLSPYHTDQKRPANSEKGGSKNRGQQPRSEQANENKGQQQEQRHQRQAATSKRSQSRSPKKKPPNKQLERVAADYHTGQQPPIAKSPTPNRSLDGANPNQQMGFRTFQQHYRVTTTLAPDPQRDRLLTFSETIQRDTTLAATTTTTVRLRSASLSKLGSQAQIFDVSGSSASDRHRTDRSTATGHLQGHPTSFWLEPVPDTRQDDFKQQTIAQSCPLDLKIFETNKRSKSGLIKRRRKGDKRESCHKRLTNCRSRAISTRHSSRKSLDLELLCSFIEQKSRISTKGNISSPLAHSRSSASYQNVYRQFNSGCSLAFGSLRQVLYIGVLFTGNLFAFQWESARQLLGIGATNFANVSTDMRHSSAASSKVSLNPTEAHLIRSCPNSSDYHYHNHRTMAASVDLCRLHQPTSGAFHVHRHDHTGHHGHSHSFGNSPCTPPFPLPPLLQPGAGVVAPYQPAPRSPTGFKVLHANPMQHPFVSQVPMAELAYFGGDPTTDFQARPHQAGCMPPVVTYDLDHQTQTLNEHQRTPRAISTDATDATARNDSSNWMWTMRHTVDGEPPVSLARHLGPIISTGQRHQNNQLLASKPMARYQTGNLAASGQQGTSFSSPTLHHQNEQFASRHWPTSRPTNSLERYQNHQAAPLSAPIIGPSGIVRRLPIRPDDINMQHQGGQYHSVDGASNRHNHSHNHSHQHQHLQYQAHSSPLEPPVCAYQRGPTQASLCAHHQAFGAPYGDQSRMPRQLSSIVGSDSELCKVRTFPTTVNISSSSASSLSSGANLIRLDVNNRQKEPMRNYHSQDTGSRTAPIRRRLNRQASSTTSDASFSHYNVYGRSNDSCPVGHVPVRSSQTDHQAGGGGFDDKAPSNNGRAGKHLDTRTKSPTIPQHSNQSQASMASNQKTTPIKTVEGGKHQSGDSEIHNNNNNNNSQSQSNSQRKNGRLATSGKSKSMNQQHSPIAVAATLGKVSLAGAKRRLGFKQNRGLNSLSVHRSEEIFPSEASERLARQYTSTTTTTTTTTGSASLNDSCDLEIGSRWLGRFGAESPDPKVCFVEGLGIGQIASRQALVSPYLGDIQVSLSDRRGMLEVEVIRVRHLQPKPYAKRLPAVYVKVYLMRNKKCLAKFKTTQMSHTLDPLYQQLFIFRDDYSNCVLQIIVWGDYGKNDRKSLMGIVQIHLNDLDMSNVVIGWYKLFNAPSMVANASIASSSKSLRQTLSTTKLVDLTSISQQQQQQQQQQQR